MRHIASNWWSSYEDSWQDEDVPVLIHQWWENKLKLSYWHLNNKESTTTTRTCEFIWLSKSFYRPMEQKRRQKNCLSLQWYFSEWFKFIAVKCYYIIFHGYSLPCHLVCVRSHVLKGYSLHPNHTVMAGCVAGETELPSIILHLRLLRGHLCSRFYPSRTSPFKPCY